MGIGTVFKMKDKRRKKSWRAMTAPIKNKITGKSQRISLGTFETKAEALETLLKYDKNPYSLDIKNLTLGEVINRWKIEHFPKIEDKRKISLSSLIKTIEQINHLIFQDIKLIDLQTFINTLECSSGTKKAFKSTLNMIFDYGMKYDLVDKNPVQFVEIGKYEKVRKANIFTDKEISILWKHQLMNGVDTILILIYTGMRINELIELKKENINLNERYIIAGSKTEAGKDRLIPIHKNLLPLIKRKFKECEIHLFEKNNKKLSYITYRKRFIAILKSLKLNIHRIHDTRHTFATLLNNSEANQTSIKNIIGHSNFELTEKVYTHKNKEELKKAIDLIEVKEA